MKNIAIITGASSTMGSEFVKQIAIQKLDEIWVIGLKEAELEELKKEIIIPLKILNVDLTLNESIKKIQNLLKEETPNVKWLINTAGIAKFGKYNEIPLEEQQLMIDLNCKAMMSVTQIVLPFMEKYSRIINVASVAAFQAVPYINTYAASKAFVLNYTRGLRQELKSKEISVTCVCPYWTKQKIIDSLKTDQDHYVNTFCCAYNPKNIVVKAIKDSIRNKEISLYGAKAKWQHFWSKLLPTRILIKLWAKQQKKFK